MIAVFGLPFLGLLLNWIKWGSGCLHALDFGIYQQAILDLAFTSSWNPMNTVRGIPIFADHFDPILIFAAWVQKLLGPAPWGPLLIEFGFYYLGGITAFILTQGSPFGFRLMTTALWFFCTGMAVAFRYPVHPTTWAALPLLLLARAIKMDRFFMILIWLNVLCLFKEYYPICFISYGIYLLFRFRQKKAFLVIINGGLWIWVDFILRPRLLPEFHGHGNELLHELLAHPGAKLISSFFSFEWKASALALAPFFLVFPSLWRSEKNKEWWWALAAFMVPVFGIQFLFGNVRFQYGAPISAFFLSILTLSDSTWYESLDRITVWPKRFLAIILLWLAGDYVNCLIESLTPKKDRCRFDAGKWTEFERMANIVKSDPMDSRILASGGVVPVVMATGRKIYQFGIWSKVQEKYELIAIGRNGASDLYPYGAEFFEKVISSCRPLAEEVIIDSKYVFFARGKFTEECLHQRHSF
ncbi:MAG: hypothetical protein KGP28_10470 [Bdellovibrionales bacterium]|nr:hypothetical protein [Bdellovibrionales bacterium]